MTNKTIVVTGGEGFVGSRLCARLVAAGNRVISLDNNFVPASPRVSGVEYRTGHTKDIAALVPETPDIIYHLGEYSRVEQSVLEEEVVHDLNTVGTTGVLEFWHAKKCKLVYAGSSTKFGDGGATRTTSPYAATKAANTERVKEQGERMHLPYAITYFYNVYGPGERSGIYGTVIESFKQMYLMGAPMAVTSPGTQERNFTHVDDIVDGLYVVGEKGQGDEYGLGNPRAYPLLEVARLFGGDVVMMPERASNRTQSSLDISKAAALGWHPQHPLEEYVREFKEAHRAGRAHAKRVLVFSTTFFPVEGPAERALYRLIEQIPDVHFDIVTASFTRSAQPLTLKNAQVYRVGSGRPFDKYLLPWLGYRKAVALSRRHSYLFSWGLMASYAALAGVAVKWRRDTPLLITLADHDINNRGAGIRALIGMILSSADQVYGTEGASWRRSLGAGDAFANQLRYAYVDILLKQKPQ